MQKLVKQINVTFNVSNRITFEFADGRAITKRHSIKKNKFFVNENVITLRIFPTTIS